MARRKPRAMHRPRHAPMRMKPTRTSNPTATRKAKAASRIGTSKSPAGGGARAGRGSLTIKPVASRRQRVEHPV